MNILSKLYLFASYMGGGDYAYEESGPSYKMQVLEFGSSFQNSLTKEVAAWGLPRVDRRTMLRRIAREMARQMWRSRILWSLCKNHHKTHMRRDLTQRYRVGSSSPKPLHRRRATPHLKRHGWVDPEDPTFSFWKLLCKSRWGRWIHVWPPSNH